MIPITRPWLDEAERVAVLRPLESGWLVQGREVAAFEAQLAEYTGARHAIAMSSCTAALHLALVALGISRGDEVVVPSFTFIATANAVEYAGGTPVLADVDSATHGLTAASVERVITARTRAILLVHLFGLAADIPGVLAVARAKGLEVIEDAACALGAAWQGTHLGRFGRIGCFSFHPRKVITTGEGGVAITDDDVVAEQLRGLREHGAATTDHQRHSSGTSSLPDYPTIGLNYRMTDLQGAMGRAQMEKLPRILERRRVQAARYTCAFQGLAELIPPAVTDGATHSYQAYVCRIDPEAFGGNESKAATFREWSMSTLASQGIATRPGTHAIHLLSAYRTKYGWGPDDFPVSRAAHRLTMTLPLYHEMSEADQDRVIAGMRECCLTRARQ